MTPETRGDGALFLLVELASRRAAFPADRVVLVADWSAPFPLPRSARWMAGWRPHEGRAAAVISPELLSTGPWEPKLLVLLSAAEEVRYFLPGESAQFVAGVSSPSLAGAPPHAIGSLLVRGADEVRIFDTSLLYRAFHLGYNRALDG